MIARIYAIVAANLKIYPGRHTWATPGEELSTTHADLVCFTKDLTEFSETNSVRAKWIQEEYILVNRVSLSRLLTTTVYHNALNRMVTESRPDFNIRRVHTFEVVADSIPRPGAPLNTRDGVDLLGHKNFVGVTNTDIPSSACMKIGIGLYTFEPTRDDTLFRFREPTVPLRFGQYWRDITPLLRNIL